MTKSESIRRAKEVIASRRAESIAAYERRTVEVAAAVPEFAEIDRELQKTGPRIAAASFGGGDAKAEIEKILTALDSGKYGVILRAKGMVPAEDGTWIYYDYVPEEQDVRTGKPEVTGKICVIGSNLKEDKLAELFRK